MYCRQLCPVTLRKSSVNWRPLKPTDRAASAMVSCRKNCPLSRKAYRATRSVLSLPGSKAGKPLPNLRRASRNVPHCQVHQARLQNRLPSLLPRFLLEEHLLKNGPHHPRLVDRRVPQVQRHQPQGGQLIPQRRREEFGPVPDHISEHLHFVDNLLVDGLSRGHVAERHRPQQVAALLAFPPSMTRHHQKETRELILLLFGTPGRLPALDDH